MSIKVTNTSPDTREYPHPSPITPSLWWVGRGNWGTLPILTQEGDCNIFLLKGTEFDVLIDCGFGPSLTQLEENLRSAGSHPSRIREIWMTHSHYDHFLGAARWTARYPDTICRISHVAVSFLQQKNYQLVGTFFPVRPQGFTVPRRLSAVREGDKLCCPPFALNIEELPGHVPDALGFRGEVDGVHVFFSGDTAIGDQTLAGQEHVKGMIGWIDGYWLSDLHVYRETLARLAAHPPDLLLPGHGRPLAGVAAKRSLKHCLRRVERLLASPDVAYMGPYI